MIYRTLLTSALLLSSSVAIAASQGAANGKPFQELAAEIDANTALIEANQQEILDIQSSLSALTGVVNDIEARLNTVSLQVEANTAELVAAMDRITLAEGDIVLLSDELRALESRHQIDIDNIKLEITRIESELANLASLSGELAARLDARIDEIRASVDVNSADISAIMFDLVLINGELSSINANYNVLQSTQITLENSLNNLQSMLNGFDLALMSLESRVTNLENSIVQPIAVCGPNGELCNEISWGYVDEDTGLVWAWASPCSGGCSQISIDGVGHNVLGWRYASIEEWSTRPPKTVFGGTGFRYGGSGSVICAAHIFDPRYNHCDYSNVEVRIPDGRSNEQWIVHDLYVQ